MDIVQNIFNIAMLGSLQVLNVYGWSDIVVIQIEMKSSSLNSKSVLHLVSCIISE